MTQFSDDIAKFNAMYKLPVADAPTLEVGVPVKQRLEDLMDILHEEVAEIAPIIQAIEDGADEMDVLTSIADLLGDLQVYCASEMAKFGIPLEQTLNIIMLSNFSKLGEDGKPIYDERGKVQKGPDFYPPEPEIRKMLEESRVFDKIRKGK